MYPEKSEIYCYRAKVNGQRKGTQISPKFEDVSFSPPPYDIVTNGTETKRNSGYIYGVNKGNICKCRPKTWKSITNLYKNKDTTVTLDNQDPLDEAVYADPDIITKNYKVVTSDTVNEKQKKGHFGLSNGIGSYKVNPQKKSRKIVHQRDKTKNDTHKRSNVGYKENKNLNKVTAKAEKIRNENIHDNTISNVPIYSNLNEVANVENVKMCQNGICKANIEQGKKHRCKCKKHSCNCKKIKERRRKTTTCTNNSCDLENINRMGAGDQRVFVKVKRKCKKVLSCLLSNFNLSNQPSHVEQLPIKPMFAIRVDSNLQILNPNEIKTKVKTLGTVGKRDKCICPSRLERSKKYGIGDTCEDGVCETARKGKYDHFNCNCTKKKIIECCDTTCDNVTPTDMSQNHTKSKGRKKVVKSITPTTADTPLFEMVLDNNHMNVLNTGEIHDVLKKASYKEMCPTGICRNTADTNRILNCKCVSKKITPILHECHKGTCRPTEPPKTTGSSRCFLCTKICHSLEKWSCRKARHDVNAQGDTDIRGNRYSNQEYGTKEPSRSRFCFMCSRICSSLGNWNCRNSRCFNAPGKNVARSKRFSSRRRIRILNKKATRTQKPQRKPKAEGRKRKKTNKLKKRIEYDISDRENKKRNKKIKRQRQINKMHPAIIKKDNKTSLWRRHKDSGIFKNTTMSKRFREREKYISKASRQSEKEVRKKEKQAQKEMIKRKKAIAKLQSKEAHRTNCLAGFLIGLVNLTLQSLKGIVTMLISIITNPIHSYVYTKHRIKDPIGTLKQFKNWIVTTWKSRDSKFSTAIQESNVMHVLSDQFEESAIFQMFENKGQTQEERQMYQRKKKRRQKRIRKRHEEALYGCRHMLLVTLRKHPWIWIYHICPEFYPHCLSLLGFIKNFAHLLLYLAALLCWTPCILCMEVVRAFLCCVLCTQ